LREAKLRGNLFCCHPYESEDILGQAKDDSVGMSKGIIRKIKLGTPVNNRDIDRYGYHMIT
jgi:hypothetical protein